MTGYLECGAWLEMPDEGGSEKQDSPPSPLAILLEWRFPLSLPPWNLSRAPPDILHVPVVQGKEKRRL